MIISVGYRVKSKNGIVFRKWANKIIKDYLIKGYAANNMRLEYLEKTIKLLDIAGSTMLVAASSSFIRARPGSRGCRRRRIERVLRLFARLPSGSRRTFPTR